MGGFDPPISAAPVRVVGVDVAGHTSIEMDSAPTQDATTGTGATMVSMLQTHSVAVKADFNVAWQPAQVNLGSPTQPSGVAYMTVAY